MINKVNKKYDKTMAMYNNFRRTIRAFNNILEEIEKYEREERLHISDIIFSIEWINKRNKKSFIDYNHFKTETMAKVYMMYETKCRKITTKGFVGRIIPVIMNG